MILCLFRFLFILPGDSPLKWAISLGVFKTEGGAQALLANLGRQGVRGARVLPRGPQGTRFHYEFRSIDADMREQIRDIARDFPGPQVRDCK